jgi:hypothetical protein
MIRVRYRRIEHEGAASHRRALRPGDEGRWRIDLDRRRPTTLSWQHDAQFGGGSGLPS